MEGYQGHDFLTIVVRNVALYAVSKQNFKPETCSQSFVSALPPGCRAISPRVWPALEFKKW